MLLRTISSIAFVIDRLIEAILATLMATMVLVVFVGVFWRYVLVNPLGWTDEVGRFSLIWSSLLGMYIAYRRAEHIRVDAIVNRMSETTQRGLQLITTILMAVFLGALTIQGFIYSAAFMTAPSAIIEIPLGVVYLALPISGVLMLFAILSNLAIFLRGGMHIGTRGE
jgi:TRAP-type C4-dicarboxylate transport system permease small subunit